MSKLLILNIVVRVIVILVGLGILFNIPNLQGIDSQARIMMGLIITLFGAYRLSMLYMQNKRYNFSSDDDEE